MIKKIFLFLVWLSALPVHAQLQHEIQSGETLYSIARQYNVSVDAILQQNPNLQPDYIMAGQKINVPNANAQQNVSVPTTQVRQTNNTQEPQLPIRPKYKTAYEVQKKETVYSLAKRFGITEEMLVEANPQLKKNKLKKGELINIPYTAEENRQFNESVRRAEEEQKAWKQQREALQVAVILPFYMSNGNMTAESQKMANLYQGFLLAVDSLKMRGYSVEVYAYDEASNAISNILQKPEMKNIQMIVGPVQQQNISSVAKFAHENGVIHVVPLSNELSLVNEHPTMFQVNVAYPLVYSQVYTRFVSMHKNDNIIFVEMNDKNDNTAYINGFKKALDTNAIAYKSVNVNMFSTIKDMLKAGGRSIIIPSSGSSSAFETLCRRLEGLELTSEYTVQLFGYPEWQTFPAKHEKSLSKYNSQFFTSFYSNSGGSRTQQFNSRFRRWFRQEQYNSLPRYGELGYDIGVYFIKGMKDYGTAFLENIHNYSYFSLEFPFNFEKKNSWSGYQNKSLLIVTYKTDGTVNVR